MKLKRVETKPGGSSIQTISNQLDVLDSIIWYGREVANSFTDKMRQWKNEDEILVETGDTNQWMNSVVCVNIPPSSAE